MKENEKKTSDQDVELNLDEVGDKVVGGRRSLKKGPFVEYELPKNVKVTEACKEEVAFDRGGFFYHGRVKEMADAAAREGGLKF